VNSGGHRHRLHAEGTAGAPERTGVRHIVSLLGKRPAAARVGTLDDDIAVHPADDRLRRVRARRHGQMPGEVVESEARSRRAPVGHTSVYPRRLLAMTASICSSINSSTGGRWSRAELVRNVQCRMLCARARQPDVTWTPAPQHSRLVDLCLEPAERPVFGSGNVNSRRSAGCASPCGTVARAHGPCLAGEPATKTEPSALVEPHGDPGLAKDSLVRTFGARSLAALEDLCERLRREPVARAQSEHSKAQLQITPGGLWPGSSIVRAKRRALECRAARALMFRVKIVLPSDVSGTPGGAAYAGVRKVCGSQGQ
jgi:hypothetical protein